jgi:putative serine protease PepD
VDPYRYPVSRVVADRQEGLKLAAQTIEAPRRDAGALGSSPAGQPFLAGFSGAYNEFPTTRLARTTICEDMMMNLHHDVVAPAPSRRLAAGATIVALGLLASACSSPSSSSNASPAAEPSPGLQTTFVYTVRSVLPSVVEIRTSAGLGSGVVFDAAGDIVTNDHVVGKAKSFSVLVNGSKSPLTARLVGTYPAADLAVIKVQSSSPLTPAKFAIEAAPKVGDVVLAMGNPLGLQGSTSEGIVSAVGRKVVEPKGSGSPGATLSNAVQTSAAINPGNSGGALVNLSGQVIGIPTLTATDPEIGGTAPGIGFAIPARTVTAVARQLIASGHVTTPPK